MSDKGKSRFKLKKEKIELLFSKVKSHVKLGKKKIYSHSDNLQCCELPEYEDLAPRGKIENGGEYHNALEWALKKKEIKNIALSGPYSSGKSSIIRSYLNEHPSLKALDISLAAFDLDEDKKDGFENELETGILKQLFYKVDANSIPQSRYRKLHRIYLGKYILNIAILSIVVVGVLGFVFPKKANMVLNKILNNGSYLGFSSAWTIIISIAIWLAAVLLLSCVCRWIRTHFHVKELNFADKATVSGGEENTDSIFNKNMDEIVYFFEATKYDTVFIQDLDRFNSTEIFIKLRELNSILNNYELIKHKRRIVFVYAIKDEMFAEDERTKFFDFIIPVIPFINSTNSGEELKKKLEIEKKEDGSFTSKLHDISAGYINLVSPYIEDMRVMINICNEFIVYKKTLRDMQSLNLKDEHMFSLMIFKNLYPKEFAELQAEKGIIKDAFTNKRNFVTEKIDELKKENEHSQIILDRVEEDVLEDLTEVKAAFMNYLTGGMGSFRYAETGQGVKYYSDILNHNFNINLLNMKNLNVHYYMSNRNDGNRVIPDIEGELKENGKNYFERCEYILNNTDKRKEEIRIQIEDNEKKIMNLRSLSMKKLIEEYGAEAVLSENVRKNKFLVFLLRNGLINENYAEYINYFRPNSITKDEKNFILGIRNFESAGDYSYELKNIEQIVEQIGDLEFKQKEILNFTLVDYMITKKQDTEKYRILMQQIANRKDSSKLFIKAYIDRGINIEGFIKILCQYDRCLWKDFVGDNSISEESMYKYLMLILKYAQLDDIIALNLKSEKTDSGIINSFILERKESLQKLKNVSSKKMKKVIEELKIQFINLNIDDVNPDLLNFIFDNRWYQLNMNMISNIFKMKNPEKMDRLAKSNYQTVCELEFPPLLDYVYQDFEGYIAGFVLGQETNTEENISAVEDILERLFPVNQSMCLEVLKKEPVVWEDLGTCCGWHLEDDELKEEVRTLWDFILTNNRCRPNWNNYNEYYKQFGLTNALQKFMDKNMNDFVADNNRSEITDDMIKEILIENISLESFTEFIENIKVDEFTNGLDEFGDDRIDAMIEERYFPFTPERVTEIIQVAPDKCTKFIFKNKNEFLDNISEIKIPVNVITELMKSEEFTDEEKKRLFSMFLPENIDEEMAFVITGINFKIDKAYVEAAWTLLEKEQKLQLLINQLEIYNADELETKFKELDEIYHRFSDRSRRHKVFLPVTTDNQKLMKKLKAKDYLTSTNEEEFSYDVYTKETIKQHYRYVTGYVKQK